VRHGLGGPARAGCGRFFIRQKQPGQRDQDSRRTKDPGPIPGQADPVQANGQAGRDAQHHAGISQRAAASAWLR